MPISAFLPVASRRSGVAGLSSEPGGCTGDALIEPGEKSTHYGMTAKEASIQDLTKGFKRPCEL